MAFTVRVLSTDPSPEPTTNIAAPNEAAMDWYSEKVTFGVNIKAMFPTYPFEIENKMVKAIYHHSDSNTTYKISRNFNISLKV